MSENTPITEQESVLQPTELDSDEQYRCQSNLSSNDSTYAFDGLGTLVINDKSLVGSLENFYQGENDNSFRRISNYEYQEIEHVLTEEGRAGLEDTLADYSIEIPTKADDLLSYRTEGQPKIALSERTEAGIKSEKVLAILNKTKKAMSLLGITQELEDYIVVVSDQLPITSSLKSTDFKVIMVGTYNSDPNSSDIENVLAHETAHAYFQKDLQLELKIYAEGVQPDHFLEPSLGFFDEGVANFAGSLVTDKLPKDVLKEKLDELPDFIKNDLNTGALKGDYNEQLTPLFESGELPLFVHSIHSRMLPAALLQFSAENLVSPKDLVLVQLAQLDLAQQELAVALNLPIEKIKSRGGYWVDQASLITEIIYEGEDGDSDEEIQRKKLDNDNKEKQIKSILSKYSLQPLEVIAKTLNITSQECATQFNNWLKS